ncbi:MAG: hypothetical protein KGJ35_01415 [Patescibacteria group bacterium]|nr:hypothetical protein [Patescibacteria group bacterium]
MKGKVMKDTNMPVNTDKIEPVVRTIVVDESGLRTKTMDWLRDAEDDLPVEPFRKIVFDHPPID